MSTTPSTLSRPSRTTTSDVWARYGEYLRRAPEIVFEWNDCETAARGWLVINTLRGGAAGGGTRMRPGLTREEVTYLAKTMELKFSISGPQIGGGKSGIDFDPRDPRREDVLQRWYNDASALLHRYYGTGGDLNVDEVRDVIPACEAVGLAHPQQGIVVGHVRPDDAARGRILHALDAGVKAPVGGAHGIAGMPLPVADLVTGYGLAQSILRFYEMTGRSIESQRVLVEGFGAVGAPCALYLAREGAVVAAVADRDGAIIEENGMDADAVEALIRARGEDKLLPKDDPRFHAAHADFQHTPGDIWVAAAASGTLDEVALDRLAANGVEVIASGANQPFREAEMGSTAVQAAADQRFAVIPDVIANCGMARAFSYLMQDGAATDADPIFAAVDATITEALRETLERTGGEPRGLLAAAFDLALDRIATR